MRKIGRSAYSWLKIIHIFFISSWLGGGVNLLLLLLFGFNTENITGILRAIQIVDLYVIVPSVMGSLVTGIMFSILTNWGFIKYRWIITKYLINLLPLFLGGAVLAPQLIGMMEIARQEGSNAVSSPVFLQHKSIFLSATIIQFILLIFALYLSVVKPKLKMTVNRED